MINVFLKEIPLKVKVGSEITMQVLVFTVELKNEMENIKLGFILYKGKRF